MRKLLLIFGLLVFGFCYAQTPKTKDSLIVYLKTKPQDTLYVQALNDYAFAMVKEGKFEEALKLAIEIDKISRKLQYGSGYYKSVNMYGIIEYSKQNQKKAMEYFLKANDLITQYKLPKKIYQNSLNNIGIIYNDMGDQENATKYAMKLMAFQEKNKLKPLKSWPYDQIGSNMKLYDKFDEALFYYKKMVEIETENKNFTGMAIGENNIGNLYDDHQKLKEATIHYQKGLAYARKEDYKLLETDLLVNLGRIFKKQSNYAKAEQYYKEALRIHDELGLTIPSKIIYQNLGDLFMVQKKYALAKENYMIALEISKDIEEPQALYTINDALADLSEKTGDYKAAYQYNVKAGKLSDTIFKIETAKNSEDLLRKYQTEKKEQEIAIKNIQINNYNKQKWYLIFGLLLLGIIGTLLFYQSRNRKKTNEKLQLLNTELDQANKVKARFFSILNHDLRSPVSSLIGFLHLQKDSPELLTEESRQRMENKTIASAENLLESMEDILLWSKGQMENFKPHPKSIRISSLFDDIQNHFASVENVTITFENPENIQLTTDENYLKTIIRNLTGNAIKALEKTPAATITWKAWRENNQNFLSIADNGPGGTKEQFKALYDEKEVVGIKSGLGLHLIRDLATAIDCKIEIDTNEYSGTTFTLILP
jgi:signal transduction histidine kinase